MPFHGNIVVIKRTGLDGATFPIINEVRNLIFSKKQTISLAFNGILQIINTKALVIISNNNQSLICQVISKLK